eukprot:13831610-Alexandrium_andersonii.AAC.1
MLISGCGGLATPRRQRSPADPERPARMLRPPPSYMRATAALNNRKSSPGGLLFTIRARRYV